MARIPFLKKCDPELINWILKWFIFLPGLYCTVTVSLGKKRRNFYRKPASNWQQKLACLEAET